MGVLSASVGCSHNQRDERDFPSVRAEDEPPPETILARGMVEGLDIAPVLVTDPAAVKGQHHLRLTRDHGRITLVEEVAPSGAVRSKRIVRALEGAGWEMHVEDSRGTFVETVTLGKGGVQTRIDRQGSPFVSGCPRLVFEHDAAGNPVERTCQDAAGRTMVDLDGCEVVRSTYDEQRRLVASGCFARGGEARRDAENVHRYDYQVDERGLTIRTSFFDEAGRETTNADGCTRMSFAYDASGDKVAETCLDRDDNPRSVRGSSKVTDRFTYDENGCLLKSEPVSASGAVVISENTHVLLYGRDAHCGETSVAHVDATGKLVPVPFAPSRILRVLDRNGDVIEKRCFDAADAPAECQWAVERAPQKGSVLRYVYDDRGREISCKAFDAQGNPTDILYDNYPHEERTRYDDRGLVVEESYFDADGAPTLAGDVARYIYRYDEAGARISFAGFGLDGAPADDGTEVHALLTTYDERHQRSAVEIRDTEGGYPSDQNLRYEDVSWPNGAARVLLEREAGYVVANRFVDPMGKTVRTRDCRDRDIACIR
ncbi:MAG: hypothetical protein HOW73_45630 [Polyangiaceae bacterium]|nr:hypothetical protein [Polyangiaceae bacterium]